MPDDICGLCGKPGADKMAKIHMALDYIYWPGEKIPEGEMVHQECEQKGTRHVVRKAIVSAFQVHETLTQEERDVFAHSIESKL